VAVLVLTSLAGAPGVTTAATALAVHWPRPVVLFEADTNGASSMMTGFFRSNLPSKAGGIEKVALASTRGVLRREDVFDPELALSIAVHDLPPIKEMPLPAIPADHRLWVVPGFVNMRVVDGVRGLWGQLPSLLRSISEDGVDVIVDLGRLVPEDPRLTLIDTADRTVILAEPTMVDLNRLYRRLAMDDLATRVDAFTRGKRYGLLLTEGPAEQIPARDFHQHVMPVLGTFPYDPTGAATFSHGRPDPKPNRNRYRAAARKIAIELDTLVSRDGLDRKVS